MQTPLELKDFGYIIFAFSYTCSSKSPPPPEEEVKDEEEDHTLVNLDTCMYKSDRWGFQPIKCEPGPLYV